MLTRSNLVIWDAWAWRCSCMACVPTTASVWESIWFFSTELLPQCDMQCRVKWTPKRWLDIFAVTPLVLRHISDSTYYRSNILHRNIISLSGWTLCRQCEIPRRFPDGSQHSSTALSMISVTHIILVLVLLSVVGVGMHKYMIQNHILDNKTQQTPTKYLYGHKYAVTINSF